MKPQALVIIGSSTGGIKVLTALFGGLTMAKSAVLVVQHMPPYINDQVVSLIASATTMPVSLVSDGLSLKASQVYVAPSERHCVLKENQTFSLNQEPKVCFVRPSIDVTMMSLRRQHGLSLTGIIVTGMGRDGADGIRHLKNLGARTWAQAPNTATISAMPLRAIETGCVDEVLTLAQMRSKLMMG